MDGYRHRDPAVTVRDPARACGLTPDQVRAVLGIPAGEPVSNSAAFMARWQRMVLAREYGELTIRLQAGRETGWEERVTHKEGNA